MELCDIREIKPLLARHGFHFSKSMGQNFLIDPGVPYRIAEASEADENTVALEIGPGIGPLTAQLARRADHVIAIELDQALLPVLAETMAEYPNVEIVPGDVMKLDLRALLMQKGGGKTPIVCANLPYNITTPVITLLLESGLFRSVTVMIQREVAKRICAAPGNGDYGAFSLLCQYYADCELLFEVPPHKFLPAPKVTSAVVRMELLEQPRVQNVDKALLFRTIRASFSQRRKKLLNGLSTGFKELSKDELRAVIAGCGFPETVRGETLSLMDFAALAEALGKRLEEKK